MLDNSVGTNLFGFDLFVFEGVRFFVQDFLDGGRVGKEDEPESARATVWIQFDD